MGEEAGSCEELRKTGRQLGQHMKLSGGPARGQRPCEDGRDSLKFPVVRYYPPDHVFTNPLTWVYFEGRHTIWGEGAPFQWN